MVRTSLDVSYRHTVSFTFRKRGYHDLELGKLVQKELEIAEALLHEQFQLEARTYDRKHEEEGRTQNTAINLDQSRP